MTPKKRILAVGVDRGLFARIEPILSRSVFTLDRVPRAGRALALSGSVSFDLMIVGYPLPDMDLTAFLASVRRAESACGASPVLVLADESRLAEVRRGLEPGRDMALSNRQPGRLLEEIAGRLLEIRPRLAARMLVRLDARLGEERSHFVSQTESLSEKRMLVRTPRPLPVGTTTAFEIHLPGERLPLEGKAQVVRHTVPDVEDMRGMGLRLLELKGDGHKRLSAFLTRQQERAFSFTP